MDNQPEALRLAADMSGIFVCEEIHASKAQAIAAELRRLHAENERLRNGLEHIAGSCTGRSVEVARAALNGVSQCEPSSP